jgi:hypothetical protein
MTKVTVTVSLLAASICCAMVSLNEAYVLVHVCTIRDYRFYLRSIRKKWITAYNVASFTNDSLAGRFQATLKELTVLWVLEIRAALISIVHPFENACNYLRPVCRDRDGGFGALSIKNQMF